MPSPSRVVLVDEDDRALGTAEKLRAHAEGRLHRALSVFVFDDAGRLLLQRRTPEKYHSGGLWSNTCCSHPHPEEPPLAAAQRRLREEMGFGCALAPLLHFTYQAPVGDGLTEHEYDHVFVGVVDDVTVRPDPAEVADWTWAPVRAIRAAIASDPRRYTVWFRRLLDPVLDDVPLPPESEGSLLDVSQNG
jgi:isopentenyl-diphosphate delta-isomerase